MFLNREDIRLEGVCAHMDFCYFKLKSGKLGVDSYALWVRKGKICRYVYKKHILPDKQGLIEMVITIPISCADTVAFPDFDQKTSCH